MRLCAYEGGGEVPGPDYRGAQLRSEFPTVDNAVPEQRDISRYLVLHTKQHIVHYFPFFLSPRAAPDPVSALGTFPPE